MIWDNEVLVPRSFWTLVLGGRLEMCFHDVLAHPGRLVWLAWRHVLIGREEMVLYWGSLSFL